MRRFTAPYLDRSSQLCGLLKLYAISIWAMLLVEHVRDDIAGKHIDTYEHIYKGLFEIDDCSFTQLLNSSLFPETPRLHFAIGWSR
jgi:hypothetical protein